MGQLHQELEYKQRIFHPFYLNQYHHTFQDGRYIISPSVFDTLGLQERGAGGEIQLTDALAKQIGSAPFTGLHFSGERFDCGSKLGFLQANLAFGLSNPQLKSELQDWLQGRM